MSLLKKKNCCCGNTEKIKCYNDEKIETVTSIKVLGAGCASCHKLYENANEAVKNLGLNVEVEYITDIVKVMEYGVMSMPALVINEKVVAMGKVLPIKQIENLIKAKK